MQMTHNITIMANFACMPNSDTEKQAKRTCEENAFQLRIVQGTKELQKLLVDWLNSLVTAVSMLAAVNFNILYTRNLVRASCFKTSIDCRRHTISSVHNRFSGPLSGNSRFSADSKEPYRGGNDVVKHL